jgi:pimeloyl-ACP methyl ester carboxylesterase
MTRPRAKADHVSPYDRLALSDTEMEALLASGAKRDELVAYFGLEEYLYLARLARAASEVTPDPELRVFVVPGIMGSQLGVRRRGRVPNDVVWIDPLDIENGRLHALRVAPRSRIRSLGVVLFTYLRLKLHLRVAGFDAVLHDYDWRLPIEALGRDLARRMRSDPAPRAALVAHSMGGLVGRAALSGRRAPHVERFVMLGTPNFGSFAPVLALRGTYAVVRKIARLDHGKSAEQLASDVFSTFPSLYQMIPAPGRVRGPNLFDRREWPSDGPAPRARLLSAAKRLPKLLHSPDERYHVVVGVHQETVTGLTRRGGDFIYTVTHDGDGTVPAACAELPGAHHYYAAVAHSELTRDETVTSAVVELLRDGRTTRIATRAPRSRPGKARISDTALRRRHVGKIDWTGLEPEQRRAYLANLNEPLHLRLTNR